MIDGAMIQIKVCIILTGTLPSLWHKPFLFSWHGAPWSSWQIISQLNRNLSPSPTKTATGTHFVWRFFFWISIRPSTIISEDPVPVMLFSGNHSKICITKYNDVNCTTQFVVTLEDETQESIGMPDNLEESQTRKLLVRESNLTINNDKLKGFEKFVMVWKATSRRETKITSHFGRKLYWFA